MNKTPLKLMCALLAGLVAFALTQVINRFADNAVSLISASLIALSVTLITIALLQKSIFSCLKHLLTELDWAEETAVFYRSIPAVWRKSFWLLFCFINLAFLFHTINFFWGNRDWAAVRTVVNHKEALSEGRFAAFFLQELLTDGKILPVANNLWAFFGLTLAALLLVKYWNLEKKTAAIVTIGLIFSITPYTLSWLYFAKNTLGILWLPAIALTALILSEKKAALNRAYVYNLISVLLFFIALGTYLPIINFIGVIFFGKIMLTAAYANIPLKKAFSRTAQTVANLTAAALLYALVIIILKDEGILRPAYNTELAALSSLPSRIPAFIKEIFAQFAITLPFIGSVYKFLFLLFSIAAIFTLIYNSPNAQSAARALAVLPLVLLSSKLTFILANPSAEAPAYLARIEFFSLPFIYALMFAVFLKFGTPRLKKIAFAFAFLLIFIGFVRIAYGLKVWKFGWEAETKLAERIITRLEKLPEFDINKQYKLLQIGEKSLRAKYYLKLEEEKESGELLNWAYYAEGRAKDAYNFFYQTDFLNEDAKLETALNVPAIRHYLLNQARPYPAKESIAVINDYIIFILDDKALAKVRAKL